MDLSHQLAWSSVYLRPHANMYRDCKAFIPRQLTVNNSKIILRLVVRQPVTNIHADFICKVKKRGRASPSYLSGQVDDDHTTLQYGFKASQSGPPEDSFSQTCPISEEALMILYLCGVRDILPMLSCSIRGENVTSKRRWYIGSAAPLFEKVNPKPLKPHHFAGLASRQMFQYLFVQVKGKSKQDLR